jgi:DNA-3-methyladenine glycosylase
MQKLAREFYQRDTCVVAKELLGHLLVHQMPGIVKIGRIVEVEAYLGQHDMASHSSKGLTKRTVTMFGPPGHAYVYLIYGMHHCFNVVTEPEGIGSAVLIRAIEPVANITERTQGPGLLTRAMRIDRQLNGFDLLGNTLFISNFGYEPPGDIIETPRIGVAYAKDWAHKCLRFYIEGNPFVSSKK